MKGFDEGYGLNDKLSRKEVTKDIWNGFDVCLRYRVELGIKSMEKWEKIHILDIFGSCVPVHLECVPVHPSRTEHVLVHVRGVPVHPVLLSQFRPVFVFWL